MKSHPAIFPMCCVWWRRCWVKISGTCRPSKYGAEVSAASRHSTSGPTRFRRSISTTPTTLFVAYSAWAEMTCFKVLGWKFPVHIFDQHTAYLASANVLEPYEPDEVRKRPPKKLPDACRAYGIEGWER